MRRFSAFSPLLFCCVIFFGAFSPPLFADEVFFADTMTVVEKNVHLAQDEHIKRSVEAKEVKTRGAANVIALESGVQKDRNRAVGSFENFSIRGISGDRVSVFVNGNLVNNSGGSAVDLSKYDGLNISKIDVYRGFVPADLGGNSFGGAINIITQDHEKADGFSPRIFALFGSFGEFRTFADLSFIPLGEKNLLSLFADYHRAKNNFKYMDFNGTYYGIGHEKDDTVRTMDNNAYNAFNFSANLKRSQKTFDINADFSLFNSKYEIPSPPSVSYKFRNRTAYDANEEYFFGVSQNFHNRAQSKIKFSGTFSSDEFNWTYLDNFAFPYSLLKSGGRGKISSRNEIFDGGYFHKIHFADNLSLSLNTLARFEKITHSNDITGYSISDRQVRRASGSLSGDFHIFTPYPEIILGGTIRGFEDRINGWREGFVYKNIPDTAIYDVDKTLRLSVNNRFLVAPLQIFADAVFAEKVPNLRQRYGYYGVIPSTDLLPEKIYSAQTGLIYDGDFGLKIGNSFFVNYCENLIRVLYFGNVGKAQNISKTLNYGAEFDVFYKIHPKIELSNNITLQNPQNLSEKSAKKLYIPSESKLKINSRAQIGDFRGLSFIPQYSYLSAYFHDLYNVHRVPFSEKWRGLSFFSFVLQYKIKGITAQAGIYDILASGNSPRDLSVLESAYFPIRYPGMSVKGSVLWEMKGFRR